MRIAAGEFKAKCLKLMDEVAAGHGPIVVTKRGKPVVKVVPGEEDKERSVFGFLKNTVSFLK